MQVHLRSVRQRRYLTLRGLSALTGVTPANLQRIEMGKARPRPTTIRRLAEALGVDPSEIADFEDEERLGNSGHGGNQ